MNHTPMDIRRVMMRALRLMALIGTATVKRGVRTSYITLVLRSERRGSNAPWCITMKFSPDPVRLTKAKIHCLHDGQNPDEGQHGSAIWKFIEVLQAVLITRTPATKFVIFDPEPPATAPVPALA